jgi:hypothetical protein
MNNFLPVIEVLLYAGLGRYTSDTSSALHPKKADLVTAEFSGHAWIYLLHEPDAGLEGLGEGPDQIHPSPYSVGCGLAAGKAPHIVLAAPPHSSPACRYSTGWRILKKQYEMMHTDVRCTQNEDG